MDKRKLARNKTRVKKQDQDIALMRQEYEAHAILGGVSLKKTPSGLYRSKMAQWGWFCWRRGRRRDPPVPKTRGAGFLRLTRAAGAVN